MAIVGGGIVGCAAAAFLAEAGVKVDLYERDEVASAASGRNSGAVQHPFDPVLTALHAETLDHYRALDDFDLPAQPAGVIMLAKQGGELEPMIAEIERDAPELAPALLEPSDLTRVEPALAAGLWGVRLETGYPVRPAAATRAFARRGYAAGARFHEGETAWPWVIGGRTRGVLAAGVRRPAGAVLVTAGPWTPEVIDPTRSWQPIVPVWGVVAEVELETPPRHLLEEAGVEAVAGGTADRPALGEASLFSIVAADGEVSVGSTFLLEEPDAPAWAGVLRLAGERFVPGLRRAPVTGARACPRPQSFDGRPLVGELPAAGGLWMAAGHGPWGISTGPASARIAADALLGRAEVPAPLAAARA